MQVPQKPDARMFDVKPGQPTVSEGTFVSKEAAAQTFTLRALSIHGMTAFPESRWTTLYESKRNQPMSYGELQAIVSAIHQAYMDAGYGLSKAYLPKQDWRSGKITIEVIEGRVVDVVVNPAITSAPLIKDFIAKVKAMRPLNTKRLERLMLVLNARPGLSVAAVLSSAVGSAADSGEVVLSLEPKPSDAPSSSISIDNYGSNFTGPVQVTLGHVIKRFGLNYEDLFVGATITDNTREMKQGNAEYTIPVFGISGALLKLSAGASATRPGENLVELEVEGTSHNVGVQVEYPVTLQRDESWFVSTGLTYRNTKTDILNSRLFDDRLRIATVATRYSVSDAYGGVNRVQVGVSKGLNILGARKTGAPDLSRQDGRSDFIKTEFSAARLQSIAPSVELLASARGQYSNHPLLSSEEFGFGGASMGRGYDSSEVTGDRGIAASIELRYNHAAGGGAWGIQPYGFYDIGKVWNIDPSDKNHASGATTGAGVRVSSNNGWSVDAMAAIPLTLAAEEPPHYANGNSPRFLISLKKAF
jgi:hemolysin activation/secretion protein